MLVAVLLSACAAPAPYQAETGYLERESTGTAAHAASTCAISLAPTLDERRDRRVLGNVAGKTVFAPEQPESWMKNVLTGLESRGFSVQHLGAEAAAPAGLYGQPRLLLAWVSNIEANKTANVVMAIEVFRDGVSVLKRDYRGAWTGLNWAATDDELQKMIDRAFGRLLDSLAQDLRPHCPPEAQNR